MPGVKNMQILSRRVLLQWAGAAGAVAGGSAAAGAAPPSGLRPLTAGAQPIAAAEYATRIARVQELMQEQRIAALLLEAGSSLEYFTGIRWWRSERTTAAVIPAAGEPTVITPFFEEPSVRETLRVPAEVRSWKEDESPFELIGGALRAHAGAGPVAVEETTRFFIVDRAAHAAGEAGKIVPGDQLVRACRMIKSSAELALMQAANDVTLAALRHLHARIEPGMRSADIMSLLIATTGRLGGTHEFSLVLLNEASAYPHGSLKPQQVREGSVILIDTGCSVHGYQSDISRSWVFGEASPRQRALWETVKRGQEIALATATLGAPVGAIDRAVRAFYEQQGWSRDYGLPGLSHRTGHGIGMDVHEPPYLVRNDETPLAAGMCFSDEPGLYIPGEFGIRLEDCWHMTESGPKTFTPLARSITQPI